MAPFKKSYITLFCIMHASLSYSSFGIEKNKPHGLQQECKTKSTSKIEFRTCSINKIIGIAQLLPHMELVKKLPNQGTAVTKCFAKLGLNSRRKGYDTAVKCLTKIHNKPMRNGINLTNVKKQIKNKSAHELAKLGKKFFYGVKVKQDLNFAAHLLIKAHNKGEKNTAQQLMLLMYYDNSNGTELKSDIKKDIFEIVLENNKAQKDTKKPLKKERSAYYKARKAERKGDLIEANKWYEIAVVNKHVKATNNLGINYAKGIGVKKNVVKAIELYTQAAQLGSAFAQQTLGNRYSNGRGVEKDINKGIKYYQQSIAQGHIKAAYELAEIYRKGKKVKKDINKAYQYYLAATSGIHSLQYRDELARSASWIGFFHQEGMGAKKNQAKAFHWYKNAALLGNKFAQKKLGYIYQYGKGTTIDVCQSFKWFTKAADQKDNNAENKLGIFYRDGICTKKDTALSKFWFTKAAQHGNRSAMYKVANQLWNGDGIKVNKKEAINWYHKSAELNYSTAQYWLGEIYARGDFVKKDIKKACEWTLKASKNKHKQAKLNHQNYCQ